jgi:hypothetical protein
MQNASVGPVVDAIPASHVSHRDRIHAGGFGRPCAARRQRHETTSVMRLSIPSVSPSSCLRAIASLAMLAVASASAALDLPKRKSGLWEIVTSQTGGPPGPTVQMCIDEKLDDLAKQLAAGAVTCSKQDVRREGDRYVAESVCRIDNTTATSRMVFSGNFDTQYKADIEARYSPPLMGMSEGRSTVSAKWLGPCRAGQRPGDVVMPGGARINLYDAPTGAPRK